MAGRRAHTGGPCPDGSLLRPLAAASRAELTGRTVWTLANAADGFGDATISLARIKTGSMNAHAHTPGGEFMYVTGGHGRVWIEGVPQTLARGDTSFIPAGLLHNAENTRVSDLIIVGITAPGVIPGSYAEVPPIFAPTGKISDLGPVRCVTTRDAAPTGARALRLDPLTRDGLAVDVRLVSVSPNVRVTFPSASNRAWVVLGGTGRLECGTSTHPLKRHSLLLAKARTATVVSAGSSGLSFLEVVHRPKAG
jgi:mannose-6-phosphate isomerase-like protein (cupin superfamily)